MSKPYHKFVFDIEKKTFVGKFEEMYKSEEKEKFDSWNIEDNTHLTKQLSLTILSRYNFKSIIDFGCGKGAFTHLLKKQNNSVLGIDISKTAVEKAAIKYPHLDFEAMDSVAFRKKFNQKSELTIAMEVLSYMSDWKLFLKKISTLSDYFFISLYLPENPIGFVKTFDKLKKEMKKYFVSETEVLVNNEQLLLLAKNKNTFTKNKNYMPGFELIGKEEQQAISEIFEKSNGVLFAHGFDARRNNIFRVRTFEKNFAAQLNASGGAACSSGTAAIYIALKALGIKEGDEVITQSFTFIATVEAILACGAIPVVVDVDDTYNMSAKAFEAAITPKTSAVIPVHMLGNPAEMESINAVAQKKNIAVIEDACEALGAKYKNVHLGLLSDAGVFSLDFGKTITTGEGGMIISNNAGTVLKCFQFIDHGHENNPAFSRGADTASQFGFNFRMTEMQAAVGIEQLKKT